MNTNTPPSRITATFERLQKENRAAFIPFIMAGDPDLDTSLELMRALPGVGADIIELGVCFTDPMADGPAIQAAGLRALKAGQTLKKTLKMVSLFREKDTSTPIILMGYYTPFYSMGVEHFLEQAANAGVDGLIIVDLPPEEDNEMCLPAQSRNIDFIRLATPTTDTNRLGPVLENSSGFVYYVSVAGVTGQSTGKTQNISQALTRIRTSTSLPIAVGFCIKTKEKAAATALHADAVVVGSALVEALAKEIDLSEDERTKGGMPPLEKLHENTHYNLRKVLDLANTLADAVHQARK